MKLVSLLVSMLLIQAPSVEQQVMSRLAAALAPALAQFPETDDSGSMPQRGNTEALWMVRPAQAGERVIEVIANPLNEINQLKAERAMALIDRNIQAAQRRAEAQYERALAEAKRTGRSQEVDGVTLSDEGIDGAKIDAESHLTIEALFNEPRYAFKIASGIEPQTKPSKVPGVVLGIPSNIYRDDNGERFAEAETLIFLGNFASPSVEGNGTSFELSATPKPGSTPVSSLVIRLRGNEPLMADVLQKADWNQLLELLK